MSVARPDAAGAVPVRACPSCGTDLPATLLACPRCGALVHAAALKSLAAEAERVEQSGDLAGALAAWRKVLELLPVNAGQHARVLAKVRELSDKVPAGAAASSPPAAGAGGAAAAPPKTGWGKAAAGLTAAGLFLLAKGKTLLVGLTQAKTFFSMAIAVGVYTTVWGWKFAVGLVLSIYVHEMGHVVWLRRYGIPATAPMFIPGFGAFVRLKQHPATPAEDARVGLAGPVWGAAAAVAALLLSRALHVPLLAAIAKVGAWINLFNLVPLWQLDGGRGFAALSRGQRGWAAAVLWLLALTFHEGLLIVLAVAASFRAASAAGAPAKGDRGVLWTYLVLVAGLTFLMVKAGVSATP